MKKSYIKHFTTFWVVKMLIYDFKFCKDPNFRRKIYFCKQITKKKKLWIAAKKWNRN